MKQPKLAHLLGPLADTRPGERGVVVSLALYFFLIMAAAYVLSVLKIAKILSGPKGGSGNLPWAYLITAVLMALVGAVNSRFLQSFRRDRYIAGSLLFFIAVFVLFRLLFDTVFYAETPKWVSVVFWFISDVFLALSVTQFWLLVNDLLRPRQAKRFIGFFVGAGLLGGFAGATMTWAGARLLPGFLSRNLLLICTGFLGLCLVLLLGKLATPGVRRDPGGDELKKERPELLAGFRILFENRFLRVLSGFMLAGFAVPRILDFQLSQALDIAYRGDENRIAAYMGLFMMTVLVAAYLINVLFTNRILKNLGFRVALLIAPVLLLGGAVVGFFIADPAFWRRYAALMRGADKSMSFSLSQSTREILYIPVPQAVKTKAKVVIDLFVSKFADVLAAVLLLLFVKGEKKVLFLSQDQRLLATLILFLAAWIWLGRRIVREYVEVVKSHLHLRWPDADRLVLEHVDVDATKLVFDTLDSRARSSVLYAMNLMDLIDKDKLTPELREIIGGRSAEIQAGSMDALLGLDGTALLPDGPDSVDERELSLQVREVMNLDVYQTLMEKRVAETAREKGTEAETSQMEIAKALGMMRPDAPLVRELPRLLRHESSEVARYALESAGRLKMRESIPSVVAHLGRPATSAAAAAALASYGPAVAGTLVDYLRDPDEPAGVRGAIPAVLAGWGSPRTIRLLLDALGQIGDGLDDKVIEALYRIRAEHPEIGFDEKKVRARVFLEARAAAGAIVGLADVQACRPRPPSESDLESAFTRRLKRLFELLSLVYPREDVVRAYQNTREGSRQSTDYALELLEQVLPRDVRDAVLPLLEDLPVAEKARRFRRQGIDPPIVKKADLTS